MCLLVELFLLPVGIDDLDEGYFVQQSVRVLRGQLPYRDFESLYTPGLLYVHAALFGVLGGPHLLAPRALGLLLRAGIVALMYVLARPLVRHPLWAALPAVFLLVGFDDAPDRWEPHPGWPSTLCALLGVWCLTRRWLVAAGVAAAAAYLFKQNAGAFIALGLVICLFPNWRAMVTLSLAWGVATALWLLPLLVAIGGRVDLLLPFVGGVNQAGLFSPPEPTIVIPILCLVGGVALLRRPHEPRLRWYVICGTALLLTQYPRSDSLHLVWSTPLLLVVGAIGLQRVRLMAVGVVVLWAGYLCLPVLEYRASLVSQATTSIQGIPGANGLRVPTRTWSDLLNTIGEIQHRTAPGEPILVYPSSPLLYVLAGRPNPTRFDHLNPGAARPAQIRETIERVRNARVRLVVVGEFWRQQWGAPLDNAPLEEFLFAEFHQVASFGQYRVLVRL